MKTQEVGQGCYFGGIYVKEVESRKDLDEVHIPLFIPLCFRING